jgi:hypothetical protein
VWLAAAAVSSLKKEKENEGWQQQQQCHISHNAPLTKKKIKGRKVANFFCGGQIVGDEERGRGEK